MPFASGLVPVTTTGHVTTYGYIKPGFSARCGGTWPMPCPEENGNAETALVFASHGALVESRCKTQALADCVEKAGVTEEEVAYLDDD